eukprot:1483641-Pyramimonas_sp.AAC.1
MVCANLFVRFRWAYKASIWPHCGPREPQERSKRTPISPEIAQERSRSGPRGPQSDVFEPPSVFGGGGELRTPPLLNNWGQDAPQR